MSASGKSSSTQNLHHFQNSNDNYATNYNNQNSNTQINTTTMRPATSSSTYSKQSTTGNNVISSPHMGSSYTKSNNEESRLAQELAQRSVT